MFSKLLCIILACGFVAGALLVNRQQQIDQVDRISNAHQYITDNEQALWNLQRQIAERCRPQSVRLALETSDRKFLPIENQPWDSEIESRLAWGESLIEADGSGDY